MNIAIAIVGFLIAANIVLMLLLYLRQSEHIYKPTYEIETIPDRLDYEYESVMFKTSDNVTLNGWFIPNLISVWPPGRLPELQHSLSISSKRFDPIPTPPNQFGSATETIISLARRLFDIPNFITMVGKQPPSRARNSRFQTDGPGD